MAQHDPALTERFIKLAEAFRVYEAQSVTRPVILPARLLELANVTLQACDERRQALVKESNSIEQLYSAVIQLKQQLERQLRAR